MKFLSSNKNDEDLSAIAQPILQKLNSAEGSEFSKEMQQTCDELLQNIEDPKSDRQTLEESGKLIGNFTLVQNYVTPLLKKSLVPLTLSVLSRELGNDELLLSKSGQFEMHGKVISTMLTNLQRLLTNPESKNRQLMPLEVKAKILEGVLAIIEHKKSFPEVEQKALTIAV